MADRIPLIVDTADGNKLKELPIGDNLNLTGSGVIGAGNIAATSLTIAGVPYNPFSGAYADLTGTPTIPTNTDDIAEGTKQYFSNERVDDRLNNFLVAGTGITLTYDDAANTLTVGATGVGSGGGGSTNLPGLTDVTITAPANHQVLKYDTTTNKWINSFVSYNNLLNLPTYSTVATSGSYNDLSNKPIIPNDIDDMSDVDTSTTPPTNGQVLKWLNNKWLPADDITSGGGGLNADTLQGFGGSYYLDWNNVTSKPVYQVSDLDDTSVSDVTAGQIIQWTGLTWDAVDFELSFTSITSKPTTLAGYGITDAPSVLTDLGISDGAANTVLTTDGSGTFTFATNLSGVSLVNAGSVGFAAGTVVNEFSTDGTLAGNSNSAVPVESAVKTYVDTAVAGAGGSEGLATRTTAAVSTNSIGNDATENVSITGFKSYMLMSIQTSSAAWVRLYTSSGNRTADAGRGEGVDPAPDAGVIAEVLTNGAQTIEFGPAVLGWNSANDTTIYAAVKNKSGGTATITTTLKLLKLEG
jgi:hypothetical protein|tara:strand:- start:2846 stop:4420 length:1575 start_codon:yes stop_codon:yes gene_type:complete